MADDMMMDLLYEDPEGKSMLRDPEDEGEFSEDYADWASAEFEGDDDFGDLAEDAWAFSEGDDELEAEEFNGFLEGDDDFEDVDALDQVVAFALEAEEADEFLAGLAKGIWDNRKKIAGAVGKVARVAAPVLSAIPLPQTQAIGAVAKLAGRALPFEAESEAEALDIVAEMAKRNPPAALPAVVGLAAKKLCGRRGPTMSMAARQDVARKVRQAVTALVRKQGGKGAPAVAQIVKRVNAAASGKAASPNKKAAVVKRVADRTALRPSMTQALANRTPQQAKLKARQMMERGRRMAAPDARDARRNGNGRRSITVTRPSRITITQL